MKFSQLLSKTKKESIDGAFSRSHDLLVRGGFINQEMAGVYSLLPLGLKVLKKIELVIREEMDLIGAQEIFMPALQPKKNWTETKRWESLDVLYKIKSRWGNSEYALGPTHEEIVFPLLKKFIISYKDLPLSVYQIQTKFRDEKRAKSGIIRGKEFGMKDLYSFHAEKEDFLKYYEKVKDAYIKIFNRCGINAKITKASGGTFTSSHSHEFMAISDAGEDTILACPSCSYCENKEINNKNILCPSCNSEMISYKAIEIGNIFDLGQKYSKDFNLFYSDKNGDKKMPFSGCYGIGTTRLIGSIVEINNDQKGIIWPEEVSPFNLHLIAINNENKEVRKIADNLYIKSKCEVLYDDRNDVSVGSKFADADLIGIPIQVIISEKLLAKESVEIKNRKTNNLEVIKIKDLKI